MFFSGKHNDNAYSVLTTALRCIKTKKPYTLAGFEPGLFCSGDKPQRHSASSVRFLMNRRLWQLYFYYIIPGFFLLKNTALYHDSISRRRS
jgi:hypothetical protein